MSPEQAYTFSLNVPLKMVNSSIPYTSSVGRIENEMDLEDGFFGKKTN